MTTLKELDTLYIETLKSNFYKEKTFFEIETIINEWKKKIYDNKYFEMLGVFNDETLVGILSIAEQSKSSASIGLEIFERYRKLGYGYDALKIGLEKAKQKGYQITINQVRTDNLASIYLCQKCELETNFYEYVNKKGNEVYIFFKRL